MKALIALLLSLCLTAVAQAEVRTFREVNGRTHSGSFQKVQGDKVHVRVRNKTVPVSFWSLSKPDQLYVLEQVKSDPLASRELKAAEDPRKWTDTRGNSVVGRFIEVKNDGSISLAIEANRTDFPFGNFSNEDQQYVRELVRGTAAEQHLPKDSVVIPGASPNANPAITTPPPATSGIPNNGFPGFPATATSTPTTNPMGYGANAGHNPTPNTGFNPSNNNIGHSATNPMNDSHPATPSPSIPTPNYSTTPMPTSSTDTNLRRMPVTPTPDIRFVSTCSKCKKEVPDNANSCRTLRRVLRLDVEFLIK